MKILISLSNITTVRKSSLPWHTSTCILIPLGENTIRKPSYASGYIYLFRKDIIKKTKKKTIHHSMCILFSPWKKMPLFENVFEYAVSRLGKSLWLCINILVRRSKQILHDQKPAGCLVYTTKIEITTRREDVWGSGAKNGKQNIDFTFIFLVLFSLLVVFWAQLWEIEIFNHIDLIHGSHR